MSNSAGAGGVFGILLSARPPHGTPGHGAQSSAVKQEKREDDTTTRSRSILSVTNVQ
jgi:hypothetical protein